MTNSVPKGVGQIYTLVKTVELDAVVGDDSFAVRVELFQDKSRTRTFRARIWRTELYRLQSTFPQSPSTGRPEHLPSDETILVDWSTYVPGDYSAFKAASATAALNTVLKAVRAALDHSTGPEVDRPV